MNIKNEIAKLIKQQFSIDYINISELFSSSIHDLAASWISDDIALCIVNNGDCKLKYKEIADSLDITKEKINSCDISDIKTKIWNAAKEKDTLLHKLVVNFHKSLEEYNKMSFSEILKSISPFSTMQTNDSSKPQNEDSSEISESFINDLDSDNVVSNNAETDDPEKYRYSNSENEIL